MAYASKTTIPVATTPSDVEKALRKASASRIATMDEPLEVLFSFNLVDRRFKISVEMPGVIEQRRRSLWRAVLLAVKAKLEAVAQGKT